MSSNSQALIVSDISQKTQDLIISQRFQRTSGLKSPILLLSGHEGEVYSIKFHPDGETLATASFDKKIFLWKVYGDCEQYATLKGHKNAVLEVCYSNDKKTLLSCSADQTVILWDLNKESKIRHVREHRSVVNAISSCLNDPTKFVSCSNDSTVKLWDSRKSKSTLTIKEPFAVTSVAVSHDGQQIFYGGIENVIKVFDIRKNDDVLYYLDGHNELISGLSVSPDGSLLASFSMDNTIKIWDINPFSSENQNYNENQNYENNENNNENDNENDNENEMNEEIDEDEDEDENQKIENQKNIHHLNESTRKMEIDENNKKDQIKEEIPKEQVESTENLPSRCVMQFPNIIHSLEYNLLKVGWSPDGEMVCAGSGDRFVYVLSVYSNNILYKLPGHYGCVNEVAFHPKEPIIGSCSTDRKIYLGELMRF
ncbi:u5 small nuclear ribonucleoprotein 40 kda protein [Anaeramoeba ignava]|uniref:U5 small nuclear ribonucleoprotein 40 kDa protein n=1 Tax=Anaeramoeba ignava TaxID=1746090 RepID=A0A9Q0LHM0_ANAIG|nr:u5 small nuclear ribonucleoprotein 40 kda protein [Anaeramoeba ignava]